MTEIHSLIRNHGWEAVREMLPARKALVDIAANILSQESDSFGITYSGFCLTALPHRKIPDDAVWQRHGHRLTLIIDPGSLRIGGKVRTFGVPYGSRARMILLYLQTRAVQAQCSEIELGRSMNEWLDRMGMSTGGKTYTDIREQANRISACNLTFYWDDNHAENFEKDSIVKGGIQLKSNDAQGSLWVDTVRLSDTFFRALKAHPVPIWEPALRAISSKSMAIDIYVWLAYRLHSLTKPMPVGWNAMHEQFGAGFEGIRSFKQSFKKSLEFALAVYPDAKVDVTDKGLILYNSRPPVEPRGLTGGAYVESKHRVRQERQLEAASLPTSDASRHGGRDSVPIWPAPPFRSGCGLIAMYSGLRLSETALDFIAESGSKSVRRSGAPASHSAGHLSAFGHSANSRLANRWRAGSVLFCVRPALLADNRLTKICQEPTGFRARFGDEIEPNRR